MIKKWDIRKDQPVVSVCSTTYNHASYIRQCLDGILMQETAFPFELLVHDDASTDGTDEIIREYAEKYPHIIIPIFQSQNQGSQGVKISSAFVWPRARGKYIALCEGDDYWIDPAKLSRQVNLLEEHKECSLCYSNVQVLYEGSRKKTHVAYLNGKKPKGHFFIPKTPDQIISQEDLAGGNTVCTMSVLFRNWIKHDNCYLPLFQRFGIGDWPLHMCTLKYGKGIYLPEVLAVYRVHKAGIWSLSPNLSKIERMLRTAVVMLSAENGFLTAESRRLLIQHAAKLVSALWSCSCRESKWDPFNEILPEVMALKEEEVSEIFHALWAGDIRQKAVYKLAQKLAAPLKRT